MPSPLAAEYDSINLGQGFPDWNPPDFAIEAMAKATGSRQANQYARSAAHLPLANVLAQEYSEKFGRTIDPISQVATAVGCTNALYCALQGLLTQGDEVILMEPAFDLVSHPSHTSLSFVLYSFVSSFYSKYFNRRFKKYFTK